MTDQEQNRLNRIEEKLDTLTSKVEILTKDVESLTKDVESLSKEQTQAQKWQDRTWDVIKWVGGISAGLSISAAIALVGIVLRTVLSQ